MTPSVDADIDYFSDSNPPREGDSGPSTGSANPSGLDHSPEPRHSNDPTLSSKLKRTACVLCRKRKLRCDAARPACGTCARLGHECEYDEQRKKSGPKRGYVKALETRLAQVEKLLRAHETQDHVPGQNTAFGKDLGPIADLSTIGMADPVDLSNLDHPEIMGERLNISNGAASSTPSNRDNPFTGLDTGPGMHDMIALGLEEPLPTADITEELNDLFFNKVNVSLPMIHKARYYAAMNLAPHMRPPVCLRYAMWGLAASTSDRFDGFQSHFYQRARKYLEIDEMRGFGQAILTLAHCQAWLLVAMYEFKNMFFPRAWMSTGRAIRLTQMLGLHRLDGQGLDVKTTVPPPRDWTEREERRRTFWIVYWADRCASIGTGWPMSFEEKDILTNLPCQEDAFQNSRPVQTLSLAEALQSIDKDFSSASGTVLMATLFGRNLTHLHRPEPDDNEHDLNGKFWERHRSIDAILLNIKLNLPDHLRIPLGINDPNVIFMNMCLHASAICLHQAAIFKAERHNLPSNIAGESKMRCIAAASEIATIMRTVSHMDLIQMNPFTSFCLYVAARVFVQFLRARPTEQHVSASLQFLLSAMHAMTRKNPLTESFIAQLELDMDSAGIPDPIKRPNGKNMHENGSRFSKIVKTPGVVRLQPPSTNTDTVGPRYCGFLDPSRPDTHDPHINANKALNPDSQENPFRHHAPIAGLCDPMDITSSNSKQDATAITPPSSHDSPTSQQQQQQQQQHQQQQQQHQQQQPSGLQATGSSYGFPGQYASDSAAFASGAQAGDPRAHGMNIEDFTQFMPPTPGGPAAGFHLPTGWENMSFSGLTPNDSSPEAYDFAKMLDGVESWPDGLPMRTGTGGPALRNLWNQ